MSLYVLVPLQFVFCLNYCVRCCVLFSLFYVLHCVCSTAFCMSMSFSCVIFSGKKNFSDGNDKFRIEWLGPKFGNSLPFSSSDVFYQCFSSASVSDWFSLKKPIEELSVFFFRWVTSVTWYRQNVSLNFVRSCSVHGNCYLGCCFGS